MSFESIENVQVDFMFLNFICPALFIQNVNFQNSSCSFIVMKVYSMFNNTKNNYEILIHMNIELHTMLC